MCGKNCPFPTGISRLRVITWISREAAKGAKKAMMRLFWCSGDGNELLPRGLCACVLDWSVINSNSKRKQALEET